MAATKYMGYIGGVAVAAGVGAAIAVAGQGTAHADSADGAKGESTSSTSKVHTGPKRHAAKHVSARSGSDKQVSAGRDADKHSADKSGRRSTPLGRVAHDVKDGLEKQADKIEKAAANFNKSAAAVSKSITDSLSGSAKPVRVKPRPSAQEFEAAQVAKLKNLFTPKEVAAPKPATEPESKPDTEPAAKTVTSAAADEDAGDRSSTGVLPPGDFPGWSLNPFRADDPTPFSVPAEIRTIETALLGSTVIPKQLQPFVREGVEFAYRGSQMIPWVNVVVPISQIIPQLADALQGDENAKIATQIIVNQLLVTTSPVSLLYYGYDQVADLLNVESDAQKLKQGFYTAAWDTIDFLGILHVKGQSGIEDYPGSVIV